MATRPHVTCGTPLNHLTTLSPWSPSCSLGGSKTTVSVDFRWRVGMLPACIWLVQCVWDYSVSRYSESGVWKEQPSTCPGTCHLEKVRMNLACARRSSATFVTHVWPAIHLASCVGSMQTASPWTFTDTPVDLMSILSDCGFFCHDYGAAVITV